MFNSNRFKPLVIKLLVLAALPCAPPLQAESINDPMRPPGKAAIRVEPGIEQTIESRFRLDSVIIAPDRRLAIINGRKLALGEWIGRAKLVDIRTTEVTLRIDHQSHVLTLLPLSIKKPSSETTRQ